MEIINPSNKTVKGPIFLSKDSIASLDTKIRSIDEYLLKLLDKDIEIKTQEEKTKGYYNDKSDDEIRGIVTSRISNNNYIKIIVNTKENITLTLNCIEELLKDEIVKSYMITDINIKISRNYHTFEMDVQHSDYNSLNYKISGLEESDKKEVNYYINSWISSITPNRIIYLWSHFYGFIFLGLSLIFCGFFVISAINSRSHTVTNAYQKEMQIQSKTVIEKGIKTPEQQQEAIELLLKYTSNYVPDNYILPKKTNKLFYEIIILYVVLYSLQLTPKTVFEIGKEEKKYKRIQLWIKVVLVIIPTMVIIPIIINRIS